MLRAEGQQQKSRGLPEKQQNEWDHPKAGHEMLHPLPCASWGQWEQGCFAQVSQCWR